MCSIKKHKLFTQINFTQIARLSNCLRLSSKVNKLNQAANFTPTIPPKAMETLIGIAMMLLVNLLNNSQYSKMKKLLSHTKVCAEATSIVGHVNSGESAHLLVSNIARMTQNALTTCMACIILGIIGKVLAKFTTISCQVVVMVTNSGPVTMV